MIKFTTSAIALGVGLLAGQTASATAADSQPATPANAAAMRPTVDAGQRTPGGSGQTAAAATTGDQEVIVTGTRATGITAAESPVPIKLVGAEAIASVGQPNLNQALTQLVPSFNAQAFGGDTGNLTLSARLRGLSPNHVLVLINGKRRHSTANLQVLGGATQGGAAPDLDLISPDSIKRIEVLEQGAAAQYGSDAIAGVINIILKDDSSGVSGDLTAGQYYQGDGETAAGSVHLGTKIGDDGFVNATAFYRYHNFSQQGGLDVRGTDQNGNILSSLSPTLQTIRSRSAGFPYVNRIAGDAQSRLANVMYNSGYDFGGVQLYSFGTYSRRTASAYENDRFGDRVIASPVLGVAGSVTTPGELFFYPNGFNPREGLDEEDFALTGGVKGDTGGWHWDLSSTYGEDKNEIHVYDSVNASLFVDTHFSPTDFYAGMFRNQELTVNADVTRDIDLGMASPLTLAFGGEYRNQRYSIGAGDRGSTYKEGSQSYPGFQATDAGAHERSNVAAYVDVALNPIEGLKVDAAGRYEHYTDFGSKVIGKLTARYDVSPAFAVRGTVSNGFRAPTLAEEYYSATNVSPTSATVQLPANSPAALLVGFHPLDPEKSMTFSGGVVVTPIDRLTVTIDAYQIKVDDRIIGSGSVFGTGAFAAIAAHGNVLDPTVPIGNISVASFTNGVDTRTRGVDATASYPVTTGFGRLNFTLSGNYNTTRITQFTINPTLIDLTARSILEHGSPKVKVIGGIAFTTGGLNVTARETFYGSLYSLNRYSSAYAYVYNRIGASATTDLQVDYDLTPGVRFGLGANNLFNKHAPAYAAQGPGGTLLSNGSNVYGYPNTLSPYGINGGYYYAKLSFKY
jgi:iron complex outermembrane receptor protein